MVATIISFTLVTLFIIMTVLPVIRNDYWTFKIMEYPRLQKLAIGLVLVVMVVAVREDIGLYFNWLLFPLLAACAYLVVKIVPYTGLFRKEMQRTQSRNPKQELVIFTANVLQDNNQFHRLLLQIRESDPDLIFLVETDAKWREAMKALEDSHPHTLLLPLDNTYGLLFYSRLPMRNGKVLFRVEEDTPSVETEVQIKSGQWVKIFGLHPKPPVPDESMYSTAKDKELMKVAFAVKKEKLPCIVMGDLNDVAWSHVTELFRKVSGLLDPRRGRGFYSTFSANHWWMRFPLDYIFCSCHFGLVKMKRMPHNGSDHFAMLIHLQFDPSLLKEHEAPEAEEEEVDEAAKKVQAAVPAE